MWANLIIINLQIGLQFRLIATSEVEPDSKEVKTHLTGLKPYTNYTVWCRSVGVNGDVSRSTPPIHFITDQEGWYLVVLGLIRWEEEVSLRLRDYIFLAAPSSPPVKIQASAISNAAVSVSWKPPLQTNGPITVRLFTLFKVDSQDQSINWKFVNEEPLIFRQSGVTIIDKA